MQDRPLNVSRILEYGRVIHGDTPVTTWVGEGAGGTEHTTFAQIGARASALAHALRDELGITGDQRVGTLLPNCSEHVEALFAVSCMGAVFNPLNKQLMDDQIIHIINHAEDRVIITDAHLAHQLAPLLEHCPGVRSVVITGVEGFEAAKQVMPEQVDVYSYEVLIDGRPTTYPWPELEETTAAALCYSTGTTGAPKGVIDRHAT